MLIKEILIQGHKSIIKKSIELGDLTLLCGYNNTGKSTFLQSVRMLSAAADGDTPYIPGHGGFSEIRSRFLKETDSIQITASNEKEVVSSLSISKTEFKYFGEKFPIVFYLSADRFGPKVSLPLDETQRNLPYLGDHGENIVSFLSKTENVSIPKELCHPKSEGTALKYQLEAWLSEISPGVRLRYDSDSRRDTSYTEFNSFRPTNVGFGLSYSLPVLAAILGLCGDAPATGWDDEWGKRWEELKNHRKLMVLIENPEAHLHPSGQTALGKMIALGAKCGVQFIVETQSDHLMDGVRIAVKDGICTPDNVRFHYLTLNNEGCTEIDTPKISPTGKLSHWPVGFFDQTLKNRIKLAK